MIKEAYILVEVSVKKFGEGKKAERTAKRLALDGGFFTQCAEMGLEFDEVEYNDCDGKRISFLIKFCR